MRPTLVPPIDSPRGPEAAAAIAELAGHFRAELSRAANEAEEVSYDLLERAADGRLSAEEQSELELRLEDEPQLRRELADLVALRGQLVPAAAASRWLADRRRRRVAGWAVAALLLAAVGIQWTIGRQQAGPSTGLAANTGAPDSGAVLFEDDFESGDSSGWSN